MSQYEEFCEYYMRKKGLCKSCREKSQTSGIWDSYCDGCQDKWLLLRTNFIRSLVEYAITPNDEIIGGEESK